MTEVLEFGIGNAECGIMGRRYFNSELGLRNDGIFLLIKQIK